MFADCFSLESLDLSNFNTSSVTDMFQMFHVCKKLKSLNLSNFYTPKLTSMVEMFNNCNELETLDVSNFNTSSVDNMGNMFSGCYNLKSLNLSNFDTSKVLYIDNMFNGCNSLTSLDISNFNTSSATNAANMFLNCYNLKSIDISHFDTSKIQNMKGMFFQCYSLENLELGNLDTSSVTEMSQMFYNCYALKSLNLNSFNTVNAQANCFNEMFVNANIIKYCINDQISEEIKSQLSSFTEVNCSDLCFDNSQKKYIIEKNKCISDCNNDITYLYEYDNICYASCPNGTHLTVNNICEEDLVCDNYYNYEQNYCLDEIPLGYYLNDTSKKTIDKCYIRCNNCTLDSMLNNLCISCNNSAGYFAKLNDTPNDIIFVNCFTEEEIGSGYYLDTIKNIYFPCYFTCKSCDGKGNSDNHQCSECYSNYTLINGNCYFIPNIETTIIVSSIIDSTMIAISTTEITKTTEITEIIETTEITKTTEITEIIETTGITETNTIEIINNLEGNSYSYDITNKQKEEHSKILLINKQRNIQILLLLIFQKNL